MKNNKKYLYYGIVVTVLIIAMVGLTKGDTKPKQGIRTLPGADFVNELAKTPSATLIDVRTPLEYYDGHIDGAVNIDFENQNFKTEISKLDKAGTYFVYCRSGNRSGQAVAQMKELGFENITELKGGILASPNLLNTNTK